MTVLPHVCPDCGGPSLTFKGHGHDGHGWRCRACIDIYLDQSEDRGKAKAAAEFAKQFSKKSTIREGVPAA